MTSRFISLKAEVSPTEIKKFQGKDHLIVPLVALVEGVLQGMTAPTPELAPASVFGKVPEGWNGRPVVVNHPEMNGKPVSANIPEVVESRQIGQVFNSTLDDAKLKMEAWIDLEKVEEIGGVTKDTIDTLAKGDRFIEVSTGLFVETAQRKGRFNGEAFENVWTEVTPDHLAILEEGVAGACSVEDGCGAPRLNCNGNCACGGEDVKTTWQTFMEKTLKLLGKKIPQTNRTDLDKRVALQEAMNVASDDFAFVIAVMDDDSFIFETFNGLFRSSFSIGDNGVITIGEDKVRVRPETDFVELIVETKHGEDDMDKKERVNALISNEATRYTEDNREWLETLEDPQLELLEPVEAKAVEPKKEPKPEPTKIEGKEPTKTLEAPTLDEYLSAAPEGVKEVLQRGLDTHKAQREDIIKVIKANKRNTFSDENLADMNFETLESIASMADSDYSGRGSVRTVEPVDDENTVPQPPSLFEALEAKAKNAA